MSWRDRPYSTGNDYDLQPRSGGARSWLGGLPSLTKAVKLIILANVAVHILCLATGGEAGWLFNLLAMKTNRVLHGEVWRLFTFTYVHSQDSLLHILFNMLVLYLAGINLERRWGPKRFFVFYTLAGFVAVSLYVALTIIGWLDRSVSIPTLGGYLEYDVTLVGASGGVLAVLGCCAVLFPAMQVILYFFPIPIRLFTVLYGLFYAYNLTTRGSNAGGDACHLAGLVFGIAWGYRGQAWMMSWEGWRERGRQQGWQARQQELHDLEREVDRILEKVSREGIRSLTRREKRTLDAATRKRQEEERRRGV